MQRDADLIDLDPTRHLHVRVGSNTSARPNLYNTTLTPLEEQPGYLSEVSTPRRRSIYDSSIELQAINPAQHDSRAVEPEFSLPPVDTGKDAWLFLFSAFVLEMLVWGTYFSLHTPLTAPH